MPSFEKLMRIQVSVIQALHPVETKDLEGVIRGVETFQECEPAEAAERAAYAFGYIQAEADFADVTVSELLENLSDD